MPLDDLRDRRGYARGNRIGKLLTLTLDDLGQRGNNPLDAIGEPTAAGIKSLGKANVLTRGER